MPDTAPAPPSRSRFGWRYVGDERPPFALKPGSGQESVWDYPRPPRTERDRRDVVVRVGQTVVGRSQRSWRVLETAGPPTFYLPPEDVVLELLEPSSAQSWCEWKGEARYWRLKGSGHDSDPVAWSYPDPLSEFEQLRGYLSFYPSRIECYVGSVRVIPQPGGFYGGWITPEVVGPFKGEPGSEGW